MTAEYLIAHYQWDIPEDRANVAQLDKYANTIANGQTIGTQNPEQIAKLQEYTAEVVDISVIAESTPVDPILPGHRRMLCRIAYPSTLLQQDMGMLLCILFGKISMAGAIRLIDLDIPPTLVARYGGPRLGSLGIRHRVGQPQGPLLMSIFKPCLGIPVSDLAAMLETQVQAGVHLVKDDEILSDPDFEATRRRLTACLNVLEKTGSKTLYALNLNGPAEVLLARARQLVAEGANALLFNYLCYGFPMLSALRQDPEIQVPIIAHPAMAGAFYGSPQHGLHPRVLFGLLPRLAGADAVLFPSPYGAVSLPLRHAQAIHEALQQPMHGVSSALGVPSAGITVAMVPQLLKDFSNEVIINAGTGIHDDPSGSFAGAQAFLKAMQATTAQTPSVVIS